MKRPSYVPDTAILARETEWSRVFKSPPPDRHEYFESKIVAGEVTVSAKHVIENWPRWDSSKQLDFINSFQPRYKKIGRRLRATHKEDLEIIEFLMKPNVGTKDLDSVWMTLAGKTAWLADKKKAFRFIKSSLRRVTAKANHYQALEWFKTNKTRAILEAEMSSYLGDKHLWDKTDTWSRPALDCLQCLESLIAINPKETTRYREIISRFGEHPDWFVRHRARYVTDPTYRELLEKRGVVEREVRERGALLSGHFLLSSGLHSDHYVQCARLLQDPRYAQQLGARLASVSNAFMLDLVISPAMGGLLIGHEVAKAFWVPFLFTERVEGAMTLRRGFEIKPGQKILIVEDVFTTGKSTKEVMEVVRRQGGEIIGAASIINRGITAQDLGVPLSSLVNVKLNTWKPEDCPLCKEGKPVVKPGSRPTP